MTNNDINLRIRQLIDHFCDGNNSVFARKIGINEANIRNYLNGTMPKFDTLYRIAEKFDTSCDWLITGKGQMIKHDQSQEETYNTHKDYKVPYYTPIMAQEEKLPYNKTTTQHIDTCDIEQTNTLKDNLIESLKCHIKTLEEQSKNYRNDCDILRNDNKNMRVYIIELQQNNSQLQQESNRLTNKQGK